MIRKLSEIRTFLSTDQIKTLVCTDIFSHLDYCNSVYFGLPVGVLQKLQRVQNAALRLVMKDKLPHIHMSLDKYMVELHWLKVRERIAYYINASMKKDQMP